MNLGTIFSRHARYRPDHPAIIFKDRTLTYSRLNRRINRLANSLLSIGLEKGDKVATLLPNCVELLEIYWACAKAGAVVVPMSTMLRPGAVKTLTEDARIACLFLNGQTAGLLKTDDKDVETIIPHGVITVGEAGEGEFTPYEDFLSKGAATSPEVPDITPSDLYNIMYSSGTTGKPKGIMLTHGIRIMYGTCFASSFRITPESRILHAGAIVFNGAFVDLMPTVYTGATYILMESFEPESFIETIHEKQVTHVMMVPAQVVAVLNHPDFSPEKLASLEMILSLGAPLLMEHKNEINRLLPGRFYELYGLTEGFVTVLDKYDYPSKPESVGSPPPLFEIKIADDKGNSLPAGEVGEICGKGPIQMVGYQNLPGLTKDVVVDGWLKSGDMGYVDGDGFLYLVDRKKDMILSGGVNVYPRDIEEIAARHPSIREVAVFGIPDDKWGETPCAAVTLLPGETISREELKSWINAKVDAAFQRLSKLVILDEFPRNVAGKVLKRELQQTHA